MVNVQDFHSIGGHFVENLIWVPPDWNYTDTGIFCRAACAVRPLRDAHDNVVNTPLNGRSNRRVMVRKPVGVRGTNLVEVILSAPAV